MSTSEPVILVSVSSPEEVVSSLETFNLEAVANPDRARSILRQTTYWVYHPQTGRFGPGKFVGYAGMTFSAYDRANLGDSTGVKFDGYVSRRAIEYVAWWRFRASIRPHGHSDRVGHREMLTI